LRDRELLIALGVALTLATAGHVGLAPAQGPRAAGDRQAIQEANRLLQEEIKLAARPQTYLIIDVHHGVVLVKARGIELHRLPLLAWRAHGDPPSIGPYRLAVRPPVDRPRTRPGEDATEHPIELSDMPAEYQLVLDPPMVVAVGPLFQAHPWLWTRGVMREWWNRVFSKGSGPWLRIALPPEGARSLAWSVNEGMPVLLGRTTLPE
jgi:hypothetical protein